MQVTLVQCSQGKRVCMEKTQRKNAIIFSDIKGYCSLWIHSTRAHSQTAQYVKLCTEKGVNFGPIIGYCNAPAH